MTQTAAGRLAGGPHGSPVRDRSRTGLLARSSTASVRPWGARRLQSRAGLPGRALSPSDPDRFLAGAESA
jgi:hypothetical protein